MGFPFFRNDLGRTWARGGQNGVPLNAEGCLLQIETVYVKQRTRGKQEKQKNTELKDTCFIYSPEIKVQWF